MANLNQPALIRSSILNETIVSDSNGAHRKLETVMINNDVSENQRDIWFCFLASIVEHRWNVSEREMSRCFFSYEFQSNFEHLFRMKTPFL